MPHNTPFEMERDQMLVGVGVERTIQTRTLTTNNHKVAVTMTVAGGWHIQS